MVALAGTNSRHREITSMNSTPVDILLDNHRVFLSYLQRRVGGRSIAEDILQDAFVKVIAQPDRAPQDEGIVPWFYRTLRNAAVDHHRRRATADRALDVFAREVETSETPSAELQAEICACVKRLAGTLKPDYAEALLAIDVQGTPVKVFAALVMSLSRASFICSWVGVSSASSLNFSRAADSIRSGS